MPKKLNIDQIIREQNLVIISENVLHFHLEDPEAAEFTANFLGKSYDDSLDTVIQEILDNKYTRLGEYDVSVISPDYVIQT